VRAVSATIDSVDTRHLTADELQAGLAAIGQAPLDAGLVRMIVRRPKVGEREVVDEGVLDCVKGLVGDSWQARGSSRTPDGSPHPDMQLTVMNSRAIALIAQQESRWPLAGDQLFVDMDLSATNVPAGTRLAIGSATIEVTGEPHTGCQKFAMRFGKEATKFVNSPAGRALQIRGVNAKVVLTGRVRVGDLVRKVLPPPAPTPVRRTV
jgi:MOSC domain-containing protein YiiM